MLTQVFADSLGLVLKELPPAGAPLVGAVVLGAAIVYASVRLGAEIRDAGEGRRT